MPIRVDDLAHIAKTLLRMESNLSNLNTSLKRCEKAIGDLNMRLHDVEELVKQKET